MDPTRTFSDPARRDGATRTLVVAAALAGVTAISLAVALIGGPPTSSGTSIALQAASAAGPATPERPPGPVPYPALDPAAEREVCVSCGTVASVKPFAVARPGHRTLGTFLGALGGRLLGHPAEKQARCATVYDVRVHMEDGTWRTVRQSRAPRVGTQVDVSGQTLRPLKGASRDAA